MRLLPRSAPVGKCCCSTAAPAVRGAVETVVRPTSSKAQRPEGPSKLLRSPAQVPACLGCQQPGAHHDIGETRGWSIWPLEDDAPGMHESGLSWNSGVEDHPSPLHPRGSWETCP